MVFTSVTFIVFFLPAFLAVYYLVPERHLRVRNAVLLLFSIVFYGWGGLAYLGLLALSVLINTLSGFFIGKSRNQRVRKTVLILAVVLNLALLGIFKYGSFTLSCLSGLGFGVPAISIALPIGISFYTFQGMSYVIDVYREKVPHASDPLTVALYIALFPQLVAGPIVRYSDIADELVERQHTVTGFASGLIRFLFGFGKKLLLADVMGVIADRAFLRTGTVLLTLPLSWIGAITFALQIYFDFSAYSDMAIGLGRMAGFHFSENFRDPYLSDSITEFWRRWHISLSSWFRDYVYIPLGGNRCGKGRQIFNLMIVWTLTGLWHGANWTFILWGIYYGILLIIEKFILGERLNFIPRPLRHLVTLFFVLIGWVIFRSDSVGNVFVYLRSMFGVGVILDYREAVYVLREYAWELGASLILLIPWRTWAGSLNERFGEGKGRTAFEVSFAVLAILVFAAAYIKLASGSFSPFIYFQF